MKHHTLPFLLLITILLSGCKKEECPAPIPPTPIPIYNKIIVYTSNNIVSTKNINVAIRKTDLSNAWLGTLVGVSYTNSPGCDASFCFTVQVEPGQYEIYAETDDGTLVWNWFPMTIAKDSGCNPFRLL
jgi:hypothetical protein